MKEGGLYIKQSNDQSVKADTYFIELLKIEKMRRKFCESTICNYKLSPSEIGVLYFLANNSTYDTAKDIAFYMGISKSLVCRAVSSLVDKGFLYEKIDMYDKRVVHLKMVEKSYEIVDVIKKSNNKFFQKLLQDISIEEIQYFERVLRKMSLNLYNDKGES